MEERGVASVAIGKSYRDMAVKSIKSVRLFWDGPIFIIADENDERLVKMGVTIKVVPCDKRFGSRFWKTQIGLFAPFNHGVFIDCDVVAVNSFERIWYEPFNADIGLCADLRPTLDEAAFYSKRHYRYDPNEVDRTLEFCGMATTHYNSGVFVFRKNEITKSLFQTWHSEWSVFKMYDQFSLARSISLTQARVRTLPQRYNMSPAPFKTCADATEKGIVFLHFWGQTKKQFMQYK